MSSYILLQVLNGSSKALGVEVLESRGMFTEAKWYWIGFAALLGYVVLFNAFFTMALDFLKREWSYYCLGIKFSYRHKSKCKN